MSTKSCGPDNIHPCVLREVKDGVVLPMHLIFQKSLTTGTLPATWKGLMLLHCTRKAIDVF